MRELIDRERFKEAVEAAITKLNSHITSGFYNMDHNPPESLFLNFLKKAFRSSSPERYYTKNALYYLSTKYIQVVISNQRVICIGCMEAIPYTLEREIVLQLKDILVDVDFYQLGLIEHIPTDGFARKFEDIIDQVRNFPVK